MHSAHFLALATLLLVGAFAGQSSGAAKSFEKQLPPAVDPKDGGKLWVVLAAGSDAYYNYRHQADICHAYQIVKKHGVAEENIIVFMRDDIANNEDNPKKGVIINRPGGPNVYPGVSKDYVGDNLKPQIFLDVLAGKDIDVGSKKTLKTGENDHIFVYFADHGAPGEVEFGDDALKATDLNRVLKQMYKEKKYKQLTFYIEACESGSMFKNLLPADINIFATTASSPTESSYACYYDEELDTYLGDWYSVHWMENTDESDVNKETLQEQFVIVRKETNTSHVKEYGDLTMGKLTLGTFMGSKEEMVSPTNVRRTHNMHSKSKYMHSVPQYEVSKRILELKMAKTDSVEELQQLHLELDAHLDTRNKVRKTLIRILTTGIQGFDPAAIEPLLGEGESYELTEKQFDNCYYPLVEKYLSACFPRRTTPGFDFAYHSVRVFTSVCLHEKLVLQHVLNAMDTYC